jgi:phosphatidylglycerophosphate synthase
MPFGGNTKIGTSLLGPLEQRFICWAVPHVPSWIHSYHLTLSSIPISLSIIGFSYLAAHNQNWLWAVSFLIALQWLTDSLDGAVGRARKEGLILWGYYMDHLLDYFFLAAILIGYMLVLPLHFVPLHFLVFAIFAGYMVNSFLSLATTNEFRISYLGIGPTEIRLIFIGINALLATIGKTHLILALPWVLGFSFLGLVYIIYHTQKEIWQQDIQNKKDSQ